MVHGIRISQKVLLPCVFKNMYTVGRSENYGSMVEEM